VIPRTSPTCPCFTITGSHPPRSMVLAQN
jgi:hypothetical protein